MSVIQLKSRTGAVLRVNSEEQAKTWEGYGYRRVSAPKGRAQKSDSAKTAKGEHK